MQYSKMGNGFLLLSASSRLTYERVRRGQAAYSCAFAKWLDAMRVLRFYPLLEFPIRIQLLVGRSEGNVSSF